MAEAIPQQIQVFEASLLDLVDPAGRPKYLGAYQSSNQLVNALAHLCGQDGRYSRLLACDENGVLEVQGAALDVIAAWDLPGLAATAYNIQTAVETVAAWNWNSLEANVADMAASVGSMAMVDFSGTPANIATIMDILTDVWNSANHAIRTTT